MELLVLYCFWICWCNWLLIPVTTICSALNSLFTIYCYKPDIFIKKVFEKVICIHAHPIIVAGIADPLFLLPIHHMPLNRERLLFVLILQFP